MAGSLSGIPLSQQFDANGKLLIGALLYTFTANTTTPQLMFQDVALTIPHVFPLPTDSRGRIPMFYLADGSVHVRLTDAAGNILYDNPSILVIGPSAGAAPSGGVDPNAIAGTGDMKWRPTSETLAGWVRSNGKTIGSAISGATERANADVAALFTHLWTNFTDTICPVSGGRGGSAAADFAANKTIGTFDMRGRDARGVADMGNSDSGRLDNVTFSVGGKLVAASSGGLGTFALAQAQFPVCTFTHSGTTLADGQHAHPVAGGQTTNVVRDNIGGGTAHIAKSGGSDYGLFDLTISLASSNITVSAQGSAASGGAGTPIQNMPPFATGYWYVRL